MSAILDVKNIEYTYIQKGKLFAKDQTFHLGPVSFSMQAGETIAIVGNNGSGKSLLAKALAGALNIEKGEILIANKEDGRERHNTIRMILQHSADAFNPALSIGSILSQTLRLNTDLNENQRREKIEETLVNVGLLREHFHFYRHMLSDGQQQRVALARALILDPEIIVADEPFAALDPSVRSQTVNLILKLQDELGLGFVFISHNIGIVRHISDRVLVMDKGVIIEQGKTHDVFTHPRTILTQKLVQAHTNLVEKHFVQKYA
ncbi:ATP-binding cassette domain-containing protein [Agaribacter marinus]|uniref:ABC transporter ATP-binding protein n=1 Tax=Agaribacter marinus TaxID=1431249 RepID=A0AA37WI87_9ALTE|nr:ATP-binding cassette domain-containing protein [Agaribacter marinus]GLR70668.1 ABC transporter ATP-binding protein [Agaribacter marinus]